MGPAPAWGGAGLRVSEGADGAEQRARRRPWAEEREGSDWWAWLAATGRGQRAAESGRWLVGSGRQAVRGDLGAGRAGLRGMGRAERAKRETKRAVLSETGRGGAGPVSRALGRAWAERNWTAGKKGWAHAGEKGHGQGMGWTGLGV